jgi:hypothetical protein
MCKFVGWNDDDAISRGPARLRDDITLDVICLYGHLR